MKIIPIIKVLNELNYQRKVLRSTIDELDPEVKLRRERLSQSSIKLASIKNNDHKYMEALHDNIEIGNLFNSAYIKLKSANKRKQKIDKQYESLREFYISWSQIDFFDKYINVTFEDMEVRNVHAPKSKSSFNFIKLHFIKKLNPLRVIWSCNNNTLFIRDRELFKNAVAYMSIKEELLEEDSANLNNIMAFAKSMCNDRNFFSLFFDKSLYLEHLANKQSLHYKIIPTEEKIKIGNKYLCEDSFIFTVDTVGFIYILWENINNERATFVFKTTVDKYVNDLQIVFDYTVSSSKFKRRKLYMKDSSYKILNSCKVLYHTDFNVWEEKLKTILI